MAGASRSVESRTPGQIRAEMSHDIKTLRLTENPAFSRETLQGSEPLSPMRKVRWIRD